MFKGANAITFTCSAANMSLPLDEGGYYPLNCLLVTSIESGGHRVEIRQSDDFTIYGEPRRLTYGFGRQAAERMIEGARMCFGERTNDSQSYDATTFIFYLLGLFYNPHQAIPVSALGSRTYPAKVAQGGVYYIHENPRKGFAGCHFIGLEPRMGLVIPDMNSLPVICRVERIMAAYHCSCVSRAHQLTCYSS